MPIGFPGAAAAGSKPLVRLGWLLGGLCFFLTACGLVLLGINRPHIGPLEFPGYFSGILIALVYSTVGLVITGFRPRLPFGWLFMALALPSAVASFCIMYALYGYVTLSDPALPGLAPAAWLQTWVLYLVFPTPIAILFMVFPNGRLPSARWRWVAWLSIGSTLFLILSELIADGPIIIYVTKPETVLPLWNPAGIRIPAFLQQSFGGAWLANMLTVPIGAFAMLARYRTSNWIERQQLKWLVFFLFLSIILISFSLFGDSGGGAVNPGNIGQILLILLLPLGTAIAILRYNLYGIDVVIRRTVQYSLLTGILALVYFGLVLVLQALFSGFSSRQSPLVLVLSTLAIAVLFNPLRLRIQTFIDRRFFRNKYDAERILEEFAITTRSEVDLDNLSAALLEIVRATVQPRKVSLWMRREKRVLG